MQVGIMVTNGGPHPADKWADVTTEAICDLIQIAADSVTPEALAARKAKRDLRAQLFDVFNEHHGAVQASEQNLTKKIKTIAQAADHVASPLDPLSYLDSTMVKVNAVLAATPFAAHFAKPEVQQAIVQIVGQHTVDVMHIERRWHQDRTSAAKGA